MTVQSKDALGMVISVEGGGTQRWRVGAPGSVDPGLGFGVLGVLNLCGWGEGWLKVLEQAAALLALAVNQHVVAACHVT